MTLNHHSGSMEIARHYRHEGDYDEGIITQEDVPPQETFSRRASRAVAVLAVFFCGYALGAAGVALIAGVGP